MDNFSDENKNANIESATKKGRIDSFLDLTPADYKEFLSKPFVIARLFCLLCALVVACCIGTEGWEAGFCKFNFKASACVYASVLGTMSIFSALFFLLLDTHFTKLPNALTKKYAIIADFVVHSIFSFLWFASFCDLADNWRRVPLPVENLGGGRHTVQAAIAFAFFAIVAFALSALCALRRYKEVRSQEEHFDPSSADPYPTRDIPFTMNDDPLTP